MKPLADIEADSAANPNRSESGEGQDVYDVFHQTVDKLHGVWKDVLSRSEVQLKQLAGTKKTEAKKSGPKRGNA